MRGRALSRRAGSSPHARGARVPELLAAAQVGIIPACAGSTNLASEDGQGAWDHPRMRGEHVVSVCPD